MQWGTGTGRGSSGADNRESGGAGMETVNIQVGGGTCAESGDAGTETGNAQVGGGPFAGAGAMPSLGASGWENGYGGR